MKSGLEKGAVQVYTGAGKGKSTAAFGLALRAAGSGLKVSIHQFLKGRPTGEVKAVKKLHNISVKRSGGRNFIIGKGSRGDIERAGKALGLAEKDINSGKYDIVILDEINMAMKLGLVNKERIERLITERPYRVELVFTGRGCPASIIDMADLVTEMKEIKHPHRKGMGCRIGIEC